MTTPIVTAKTITFTQLVTLLENKKAKATLAEWVRNPDGTSTCKVTLYRTSGLVVTTSEFQVTRLPEASLENE